MVARALLVTASLLGLAACSGGESKQAETTAEAPAATTANETVAAAPAAAAPGAPAASDVATVSGVKFADFKGDVASGEKVFLQCKTCHVTDEGQNRIGPSLHAVVGRAAGSVAGYQYTPANKNSGITWSKDKLFQYLENPQRVIPGTKMAFGGIADPQKRADLIEWLATK